MPCVNKSKKTKINEDAMNSAIRAVKSGQPKERAAILYGIAPSTLRDRLKKQNKDTCHGNQQEATLAKYLITSAKMYFGLSYFSTRRLAYEYALKLKHLKVLKNFPKAWEPKTKGQQGLAGRKWLYCFQSRHPQLTLRKPQMVSLGRASSFNQHNVKMFFDNLKDVVARFEVLPENIWNMDETALTTVHKSKSVIAQRGVRHLGSLSSAERGDLVTLALCVSARGVCMPPFYVFPRKKFHDHFLMDAANGAAGDANPSGWMKKEQFLKFLIHFERYARPSKDVKSLLILDNHESHMSIEGLDYCNEHGIVVLTLPPHTSHKLQPLDRSVFKPIKTLFFKACSEWMRSKEHADKTITIHDIPKLSCDAIKQGASVANIEGGFRASGIYPLNENIFGAEEFCSASFTDRPPDEGARPYTPVTELQIDEINNNEIADYKDDASNIDTNAIEICEAPVTELEIDETDNYEIANYKDDTSTLEFEKVEEFVSTNVKIEKTEIALKIDKIKLESVLEEIQPFPKARPRKKTNSGRKVRKTAILTDVDLMNALRSEQQAVAEKKAKQLANQQLRAAKKFKKEMANIEAHKDRHKAKKQKNPHKVEKQKDPHHVKKQKAYPSKERG